MDNINAQLLIAAAEKADIEARIYENYSGRCMYGSKLVDSDKYDTLILVDLVNNSTIMSKTIESK